MQDQNDRKVHKNVRGIYTGLFETVKELHDRFLNFKMFKNDKY